MGYCNHHPLNTPQNEATIVLLLQKYAPWLPHEFVQEISRLYTTHVRNQQICIETAITFFSHMTCLVLIKLEQDQLENYPDVIQAFENLVIELHGQAYDEYNEGISTEQKVVYTFRAHLLASAMHQQTGLARQIYKLALEDQEEWMLMAEIYYERICQKYPKQGLPTSIPEGLGLTL